MYLVTFQHCMETSWLCHRTKAWSSHFLEEWQRGTSLQNAAKWKKVFFSTYIYLDRTRKTPPETAIVYELRVCRFYVHIFNFLLLLLSLTTVIKTDIHRNLVPAKEIHFTFISGCVLISKHLTQTDVIYHMAFRTQHSFHWGTN